MYLEVIFDDLTDETVINYNIYNRSEKDIFIEKCEYWNKKQKKWCISRCYVSHNVNGNNLILKAGDYCSVIENNILSQKQIKIKITYDINCSQIFYYKIKQV